MFRLADLEWATEAGIAQIAGAALSKKVAEVGKAAMEYTLRGRILPSPASFRRRQQMPECQWAFHRQSRQFEQTIENQNRQ